ncbi:hypothetical protein KXD93_19765 [Mucilaginibacter sp. BJC16-A38]|uniref:hypothetical protein n=1 Tax=Mucilaginibacter phenanthrenivorans TaxID=1234842 RepID=UPI002157F4B4|nr:hypothetical protein [Mucilaginibacter phenanthrenivorans]MCR8559898.1 hypothetical protein [Mucilaginibacter phenanthrenivorans]
MSVFKYLLLICLIFVICPAFSQSNDPVMLKWKLKPGEVISYKTTMDEIDTAHSKDFSIDGFDKLLGSDVNSAEIKKMIKQLRQATNLSNFVTHLKKNSKNVIDIEMKAGDQPAAQTTADTGEMGKALKLMMATMGGVVLRGAIREDGTIESFYTKNDQKNLIATFFELPGRPVRVGDTWSADVHFLSTDQSFICDSSHRRNIITIVKIDDVENEHVVTVKYDIEEYVSGYFSTPFDKNPVKTTMRMTHKALADFSIERGRWINYDGIMSISSTGFMSSQSAKRCNLTLIN